MAHISESSYELTLPLGETHEITVRPESNDYQPAKLTIDNYSREPEVTQDVTLSPCELSLQLIVKGCAQEPIDLIKEQVGVSIFEQGSPGLSTMVPLSALQTDGIVDLRCYPSDMPFNVRLNARRYMPVDIRIDPTATHPDRKLEVQLKCNRTIVGQIVPPMPRLGSWVLRVASAQVASEKSIPVDQSGKFEFHTVDEALPSCRVWGVGYKETTVQCQIENTQENPLIITPEKASDASVVINIHGALNGCIYHVNLAPSRRQDLENLLPSYEATLSTVAHIESVIPAIYTVEVTDDQGMAVFREEVTVQPPRVEVAVVLGQRPRIRLRNSALLDTELIQITSTDFDLTLPLKDGTYAVDSPAGWIVTEIRDAIGTVVYRGPLLYEKDADTTIDFEYLRTIRFEGDLTNEWVTLHTQNDACAQLGAEARVRIASGSYRYLSPPGSRVIVDSLLGSYLLSTADRSDCVLRLGASRIEEISLTPCEQDFDRVILLGQLTGQPAMYILSLKRPIGAELLNIPIEPLLEHSIILIYKAGTVACIVEDGVTVQFVQQEVTLKMDGIDKLTQKTVPVDIEICELWGLNVREYLSDAVRNKALTVSRFSYVFDQSSRISIPKLDSYDIRVNNSYKKVLRIARDDQNLVIESE